MKDIIHQSDMLFNYFLKINLCQMFSHFVIKHIMAITISALSLGYKGKTVNFEKYSPCHRTTIAHFLNNGKWSDDKLKHIIKSTVITMIYAEAMRTGMPIYCKVDDTVSSKTKPSSRALHPIEDAYFHHSHLKKKQDYGHQAVAIMLSCNKLELNYDIIMYDKSKTKIQLVQDVAKELPIAPVMSYLLCDSWYSSQKIIDSFTKKGFYTVGALKTNRVIYPCGIKIGIHAFALHMRKTDKDIRLVTVGSRQYYVYRYEGKLNGVENAIVLITYPKDAFHNAKALRAFICTDISLNTNEMLSIYKERWPIEVFFRQCKNKLALDQYQIRSSKGVKRFWLIMSLVHLMCCTGTGESLTFQKGYSFYKNELEKERFTYVYQCGVRHIPLDEVLAAVV